MARKRAVTTKVGRDAKTGRFYTYKGSQKAQKYHGS